MVLHMLVIISIVLLPLHISFLLTLKAPSAPYIQMFSEERIINNLRYCLRCYGVSTLSIIVMLAISKALESAKDD